MAKKRIKKETSENLFEIIIKGIQEKKGKDIVSLDLRKLGNSVSDYFIVCHGNSNTQVLAIADSIQDEVQKATGVKPWHKEGMVNAEWILLDYANIVVHIFQETQRQFYKIEKLWADAEITQIETIN
jgi:ribosome-associated protein